MQLETRISVSDVSTAFQMAVAGHGFAILPNVICAEALGRGDLRRVLEEWEIATLDVTASFLERRHLPARIRALLDFVRVEARQLTRNN